MKRKRLLAAGGILLLLLFPYIVTLLAAEKEDGGSGVQIPPSGKVICRQGALGTEELDLEEYVIGVAAAQIPGDYEKEAVAAQMTAARTYLYKTMGDQTSIGEEEISCGYLDREERLEAWGEEAEAWEEKFRLAASETAGQVITFQGELIDPMFHRASAGMTRDGGEAFPYLEPVDSSGDLEMENFVTILEMTGEEAAEAVAPIRQLPVTAAEALEMQITARDSSGYVTGILVGTEEYTGEETAEALGLPSPSFSVTRTEKGLKFVVKGAGHGYGLSQWGAHMQALSGQESEAILAYYFQNTSIENILNPE